MIEIGSIKFRLSRVVAIQLLLIQAWLVSYNIVYIEYESFTLKITVDILIGFHSYFGIRLYQQADQYQKQTSKKR